MRIEPSFSRHPAHVRQAKAGGVPGHEALARRRLSDAKTRMVLSSSLSTFNASVTPARSESRPPSSRRRTGRFAGEVLGGQIRCRGPTAASEITTNRVADAKLLANHELTFSWTRPPG